MLPSIRIHSPFKFDDMWKTKTKSEIVYKRIPDCVNSHFRVEIIHNFKFAPSPFNPAIIQLQRVYIYVQFRRKVHKRHRPANKYTSIILVIFGMFFFSYMCTSTRKKIDRCVLFFQFLHLSYPIGGWRLQLNCWITSQLLGPFWQRNLRPEKLGLLLNISEYVLYV